MTRDKVGAHEGSKAEDALEVSRHGAQGTARRQG